MSFFNYSSRPRRPRGRGFRGTSSWAGPPDNWAPGIVPLSLVVTNSAGAAIFISRIAAYPNGMEFELTTVMRAPTRDETGPKAIMHGGPATLFGVEYANGARATLPPSEATPTDNAARLTLVPYGGSGTEAVIRQTIWAAPLPPPGPVTLAAAWPSHGLSETSTSFDGGLVLEAAERAVQLWPDEPEREPEADFSNAPALPPAGAPPEDPERAEREIRTAFAFVFNSQPPPHDPLLAVQDGPALAGAAQELGRRFPLESSTSRIALDRVVFLDEVRAAITFQLLWAGAPGFGPQLGYAVRDRGTWKVARDTYCRVLGWAGVQCPPAPPVI